MCNGNTVTHRSCPLSMSGLLHRSIPGGKLPGNDELRSLSYETAFLQHPQITHGLVSLRKGSPFSRHTFPALAVLIQSWDKQLETGLNFCSAPFMAHFLDFSGVTGDQKSILRPHKYWPPKSFHFGCEKRRWKRGKNPMVFSWWFTNGFTDSWVHKTADSSLAAGFMARCNALRWPVSATNLAWPDSLDSAKNSHQPLDYPRSAVAILESLSSINSAIDVINVIDVFWLYSS